MLLKSVEDVDAFVVELLLALVEIVELAYVPESDAKTELMSICAL